MSVNDCSSSDILPGWSWLNEAIFGILFILKLLAQQWHALIYCDDWKLSDANCNIVIFFWVKL